MKIINNTLIKSNQIFMISDKIILNSDKIFVINQGLVADEGSHSDLLNTSEIYKNFYEKQIKKK